MVTATLEPLTRLQNNPFRNSGECRRISRNVEGWIGGTRRGLMMIEKETDEIGRMGKLKKQNEMR
jgi:hypothetical protein